MVSGSQPATLKQALAVAEVVRRRQRAAITPLLARVAQLEAEVQQLQEQAAAPRAALPPLAQLVAAAVDARSSESVVCAAGALHIPGSQQQADNLALWHRAAALLPAKARLVLCQAQRYQLLQLQLLPPSDTAAEDGSSAGGGGSELLPSTALLVNTPAVALLNLARDILLEHSRATMPGQEMGDPAEAPTASAAAEEAPTASQQPQQSAAPLGPPPPSASSSSALSASHGPLLASTCSCLVALFDLVGEAATRDDCSVLCAFCQLALELCVEPAPPGGDAGEALPEVDAAVMAGAVLDLQQPNRRLAAAVLGRLCESATAGLLALSVTAPAVRATVAALVEAVTGEQPVAVAVAASAEEQVLHASAAAAHPDAAGAAIDDEAQLEQALGVLNGQLSEGLRRLPQWVWEVGGSDACSELLQGVAQATTAARDLSKLVAVTHPLVGRWMQRAAAQLSGALHRISTLDAAGRAQ